MQAVISATTNLTATLYRPVTLSANIVMRTALLAYLGTAPYREPNRVFKVPGDNRVCVISEECF